MSVADDPANRGALQPSDVVLVGFSEAAAGELRMRLGGRATVLDASSPEQAARAGGGPGTCVVCLGPELAGPAARDFLLRLEGMEGPVARVVLAAGEPVHDGADGGSELPGPGVLYYRSASVPPLEAVGEILAAACAWEPPGAAPGRPDPARLERVLSHLHGLPGDASPLHLARVLAFAAADVVAADTSHLWLHDSAEQCVWAPASPTGDAVVRRSASAGVVGFVARTGLPVRLPRAREDGRFSALVDDPLEAGAGRLLAVPLGVRGGVEAVLCCGRRAEGAEFSAADQEDLGLLATLAAPAVSRSLLLQRYEEEMAVRTGFRSGDTAEMFREAALRHHLEGEQARARVLELSPAWMRWSYRFVLLSFVALLLFLTFGRTQDYAVGRGVVLADPERVLIAFPGADRPLLESGMVGSFEIDGFRRGTRKLVVHRLSDEVIGPADARRRVGGRFAELLPLDGPVTLAWADLEGLRFESGGRSYRLSPGMQGSVEVTVRSRSLLAALFTGLGGSEEPRR